MAFLERSALLALGFRRLGENVLISDKASLYNCPRIEIGSNVRIDDFSVLSAGKGGIVLGDFVHIAASCLLIGAGRIALRDFAGLSSRVSIYSSSDDYSGASLTNPTVPDEYKNVFHADVILDRHVIVGSGSVIMPGVTAHEGAAIGALTFVRKDCESFAIYSGNPAKRVAERDRALLAREQELLQRRAQGS